MMVFRAVTQSAPLRKACMFIYLIQCLFLFPSEASQIVSARQQLYVPQREPKYPGNQASFSL